MTPSPEWTDALLTNPHDQADKRSRVQKMFTSIAPRYDLNNRLHSFGRDQAWRRKAVQIADIRPLDTIVDVACGTGDLTFQFSQWLNVQSSRWPDVWKSDQRGRVIAIDFTYAMLPLLWGKEKKRVDKWLHADKLDDEKPYKTSRISPFERLSEVEKSANAKDRARTTASVAQPNLSNASSDVFVINGDAQALPLPDACCDVVSIAFGIRNVQSVPTALAEFYRVLRPSGRLIVLEFAQPRNRVIRFFNDLYTARIMPHTATWISGDKSGAYKYLPKSVETFISRAEMKRLIGAAGFGDVTEHAMTFGVCVCYRGVKQATDNTDKKTP